VSCGADINCFSVNSGKLIAKYPADEDFGKIVNLCFHPSDDKLLIAIHFNGIIVFWNLIGTQSAKLLKQHVIILKFLLIVTIIYFYDF